MSETTKGKTPLEHLAQSVQEFNVEAQQLREDVRLIDEKSQRDRKFLRLLVGLVVGLILLMGGLLFIGFQNNSNGRAIRDCSVPTGVCAQRTDAQIFSAVNSITYRTEAERLKTEIAVAQAKGDDVAAQERSRRLAEVQKQVDDAARAQAAIRSQIQ